MLTLGIACVTGLVIGLPQAFASPLHQDSAPNSSGYTYVVQPGDYWALVAQRTGVSVGNLMAANPQASRPSGWLMQGEKLFIPTSQPPAVQTHLVQRGESWSSIADDYQMPVKLLIATNSQFATASLILPQGINLTILSVPDAPSHTERGISSGPDTNRDLPDDKSESPQSNAPSQTVITQTAGLALISTQGIFSLYPLQAAAYSRQLVDMDQVRLLSDTYNGTVRLQFALVHGNDPGNNWTFFYNPELGDYSDPEWIWYDFLMENITGSTHGPPFFLTNPISTATVVGGDKPSDLSSWISAALAHVGAGPESIARLVFTVDDGETMETVVYYSDLTEDGILPPIDGPNRCSSNISNSLYCRIVHWWANR